MAAAENDRREKSMIYILAPTLSLPAKYSNSGSGYKGSLFPVNPFLCSFFASSSLFFPST
jgi:hypothetical protein